MKTTSSCYIVSTLISFCMIAFDSGCLQSIITLHFLDGKWDDAVLILIQSKFVMLFFADVAAFCPTHAAILTCFRSLMKGHVLLFQSEFLHSMMFAHRVLIHSYSILICGAFYCKIELTIKCMFFDKEHFNYMLSKFKWHCSFIWNIEKCSFISIFFFFFYS